MTDRPGPNSDSRYSGGDPSGRVEKALSRAEDPGTSPTEKIETLRSVIDFEVDPNWRSLLHVWIGTQLILIDRNDEADREFLAAIQEAEFERGNFKDTATSYIDALFFQMRDVWDAETDPVLILKAGLPALPFLETYPDDRPDGERTRTLILSVISSALFFLARRLDYRPLEEVSLQLDRVSLGLQPDSSDRVTDLAWSYYLLAEYDRAASWLDRLAELLPEGEWDEKEKGLREKIEEARARTQRSSTKKGWPFRVLRS